MVRLSSFREREQERKEGRLLRKNAGEIEQGRGQRRSSWLLDQVEHLTKCSSLIGPPSATSLHVKQTFGSVKLASRSTRQFATPRHVEQTAIQDMVKETRRTIRPYPRYGERDATHYFALILAMVKETRRTIRPYPRYGERDATHYFALILAMVKETRRTISHLSSLTSPCPGAHFRLPLMRTIFNGLYHSGTSIDVPKHQCIGKGKEGE
jgi:hypothetical protein